MKRRRPADELLSKDAAPGFRASEVPAQPAPSGVPCLACGEPVDEDGKCEDCARDDDPNEAIWRDWKDGRS